MDETVIATEGLTKSYGRFQALKGLDLSVERGEVHGFLGPNGAGKSTTIRVLLGLIKADGGRVGVLGSDPWRDVVGLHRRLAYVPGDVSLWPSMTGGEAIDLLGSLRGGLDESRRADLVERFELDPTKRGRQYSKGNRQKVALIAALASDVELLILDEPTSGLDPLMENVFQEVIGEAKQRGATVLLSSHILSEAESLADRMSIIRDGRIVQTGTFAQLQSGTRTTIHADLARPFSTRGVRTVPGARPAHRGLGLMRRHHAAESGTETIPADLFADLHIDGTRIQASVDSSRIGEAMAELTPFGITALTVEPPSLESLFLRLYESDDQAGEVSR